MRATLVRSFSVRVFDTPLKRPFVTALGRKTSTCNVGLTIALRGGARGYGEASASLALAHLRPRRLAQVLERLARGALGRDAAGHRPLVEAAWRDYPGCGPAVSAFECALLGACARARKTTLASWLGGKLSHVDSDITISAWDDPRLTAEAVAEAAAEGFRVFKVKVGGGDLRADLARVRAVRTAAGRARPGFILDGNQGLNVSSALRLVEACLKSGLRLLLLEQPLSKEDFRGMAALTRRCPVPVAADEMAHSPADAVRIVTERCASAVNVKLAKSGITRGLEIAAVARAAGLPLMIGCMAETAAGLMPSVHMALGTGFFRFIDLDSDHLLKDQAPCRDWVRRGPRLSLP
ncbi:MAG: enolase C-terminal domain-like protein [Elusimicrobia bacterium]|nr:enolase C-terminal domain-like protein [Elusimicrobiota bacterium]